jgi:DNA-binding NtrC family response regulator
MSTTVQTPAPDPLLACIPVIGVSRTFTALKEKLARFSEAPATVLITGETGTGKDLFARAIHHLGPRRDHPFIPVNCAALPDTLFENELFGHTKGAFTGAGADHPGLLAEAEGGTLFLDEINALSLSGQAKLLRFLQDRSYRPLGGRRSYVANVRVIGATNMDLRELVVSHVFREDLFHRLNVLSLCIPPLRDRRDDIEALARYFTNRFSREYGQARHLSHAALARLIAYDWPGNVRELESLLQRAVVLSAMPEIGPEDLDLPVSGAPARDCLKEARTRFEASYLRTLLESHGGNISRAARTAGTDRRSLQRMLRRVGLDRRAFLDPS